MYKIDEVGKFIRERLTEDPSFKNRVLADLVVNHFPDKEFNVLTLRQRIANFKYLAKKRTMPLPVVQASTTQVENQ